MPINFLNKTGFSLLPLFIMILLAIINNVSHRVREDSIDLSDSYVLEKQLWLHNLQMT
jgi:hypothetical protein